MKTIKIWAPSIAWMGVIFLMSAMPGDMSGEQSGRLLHLLISLLTLLLGEETAAAISPDMLHLLIRKAAHMAEYAVLFFLYRRALRQSGVRRPGLYALLMSIAYACTDEWHQSFSEGRSPGATDVGIDTLGALAMWGLNIAAERLLAKRRKTP